MKSEVTFIVEHDDTLDTLETFALLACGLAEYADGLENLAVIDHSFKVDIAETLDDLGLTYPTWEHMDESVCDDPENTESHPFCFKHDRRVYPRAAVVS